jgi:hypothetical protein
MPSTARRSLMVAAVSIFTLALIGAQAFGLPTVGTAVPQLQPPAGLGGAPVSTPTVPHITVPHVTVPQVSVPHVSVPSGSSSPSTRVPSVSVPSVGSAAGRVTGSRGSPSVRVPGGGRSSASAAARGSGGGSGPSGAAGNGSGSGHGGSSPGSSKASRASAARAKLSPAARRAQRHAAQERRLRNTVKRYAGCLSQLGDQQAQLLSIRAGVDSPPVSRPVAAAQLGISLDRARALERGGLRELRSAGRSGQCGSSSGASRRDAVAMVANGSPMPQLQPAVMLTPRPTLTTPTNLAQPRGQQAVKGAHASSGASGYAPTSPGATPATSSPPLVHGTESASKSAGYLIGLAVLALLLGILLITWRRRNIGEPMYQSSAPVGWPPGGRARPEAPNGGLSFTKVSNGGGAATVAAPVEAPEEPEAEVPEAVQEPEAQPVDETEPEAVQETEPQAATEPEAAPEPEPSVQQPYAPAPPAPAAPQHDQRRPVAVVAASLVSLGVALLSRRRRRR